MSEEETSAEEFEGLLRQLDPKRQKMVGVYVHLLAHDCQSAFKRDPRSAFNFDPLCTG